MVVGFTLTPGYSTCPQDEASPKMIQDIARAIPKEDLLAKCDEFGLTEIDCDEGCTLDKFLDKYQDLPTEDGTCNFYENGVMQSATGGSGHQGEREIICKAFGILVLNECLKRGLSVSFNIE